MKEITGTNLNCTKKHLVTAFYLFLDDALPHFPCELIEQRGNYLCRRCDDCMMEQYIRRAKAGEKSKKERAEKRGNEDVRAATVEEAIEMLSTPCYENKNYK